MALLWMDGFECYAASGALTNTLFTRRGYTATDMDYADQDTGRIAGNSISVSLGGSSFQTPSLTTDDTLIFGFAIKFDDLSGITPTDRWFLTLKNGATNGMTLRVSADGELSIFYGDALYTVGEKTVGLGLASDVWYYIEGKVKCNSSTGTWLIKVDGNTVLSQTGKNTKQAGSNDYYDSMLFQGVNNKSWWDDLYICDTSGSLNNDFLGNSMISVIQPTGDNSVNWSTAEPAGDHWSTIDDGATSDDDTTYIEDSTTGHKDLFDYGNTSGLSSIKAIQILTNCRVTGVETLLLKQVVKSDSTEDSGANNSITSTSYTIKNRILETDPHTSAAWDSSAIDAAQFGVELG